MRVSRGENVHEVYMAYDPSDDVFFMDCSHKRWETTAHVDAHFARLVKLWREWTGGTTCDLVIGYVDFQFDMTELGERYRAHVMRTSKHFRHIIRWGLGADPLLRSTQRVFAIKMHRPSHIYENRDDALAVLRGLRSGEVEFVAT